MKKIERINVKGAHEAYQRGTEIVLIYVTQRWYDKETDKAIYPEGKFRVEFPNGVIDYCQELKVVYAILYKNGWDISNRRAIFNK